MIQGVHPFGGMSRDRDPAEEKACMRPMRWGPAVAAAVVALSVIVAGSVFETAVGHGAKQPLLIASRSAPPR